MPVQVPICTGLSKGVAAPGEIRRRALGCTINNERSATLNQEIILQLLKKMGLLDSVKSAVGEEQFKKYADKVGGEEKVEDYVEKFEQNETVKKYAEQYGVSKYLNDGKDEESTETKTEAKTEAKD